jgi:hypothetical protein
MPGYFLDTSALGKRYHVEAGFGMIRTTMPRTGVPSTN